MNNLNNVSLEFINESVLLFSKFLDNICDRFDMNRDDINSDQNGFSINVNGCEIIFLKAFSSELGFVFSVLVRVYNPAIMPDGWELIKSNYFEYPVVENIYYFCSPQFLLADLQSQKVILNTVEYLISAQSSSLDQYSDKCEQIIADQIRKKIMVSVAAGIGVTSMFTPDDMAVVNQLFFSFPPTIVFVFIINLLEKISFRNKCSKLYDENIDV